MQGPARSLPSANVAVPASIKLSNLWCTCATAWPPTMITLPCLSVCLSAVCHRSEDIQYTGTRDQGPGRPGPFVNSRPFNDAAAAAVTPCFPAPSAVCAGLRTPRRMDSRTMLGLPSPQPGGCRSRRHERPRRGAPGRAGVGWLARWERHWPPWMLP
ncbi:hypothetical protein EDC01DRAFT_658664 [Geopyxis carbonaria]|nr:hypothetical protein EDC01DRAFT_658664 [Geopyxis carbonaria]